MLLRPEAKFGNLATRVCRDQAEFVAELAREYAPQPPGVTPSSGEPRTGTLRDSIRAGPAPDDDGWAVYVDAPYWRYVEYGTETRGGAQPFIRRAMDAWEAEVGHAGRGGPRLHTEFLDE